MVMTNLQLPFFTMTSLSPPPFSHTKIFVSRLLLFFISLSSSYATSRINHVHQRTTPYSPNIIRPDVSAGFVPGQIVEKKFSFLGASGPSIGHHAGYYSLSKSARMFYFFFESRNSKDDPVVIWLAGGPGCSGSLALFYENGPFHISNNLSLVWNDFGWDKASNILFIDQPIGTGFSYTSNLTEIPRDETTISNDLYDFLQGFFKEHPDLIKNDFYITGESFAGHYIPALASRIQKENKQKQGIIINLKGFAIGNGLTNPAIQYPAYSDYAFDMGLITKSDQEYINNTMLPRCESAIQICDSVRGFDCELAHDSCEEIFIHITLTSKVDNINYYDIRKKCVGDKCYDYSKVETFLNEKSVRDDLGVGDLKFVSCSVDVYQSLLQELMLNLEEHIPSLLEDGIKMLVYAGEFDLEFNWLGNSRWVHALEWSGKKQFGKSPIVPFLVDGVEAGSLNSYGPLSFLKVKGAGHMVAMDQPKGALQMLTNWMQGKLNATRA